MIPGSAAPASAPSRPSCLDGLVIGGVLYVTFAAHQDRLIEQRTRLKKKEAKALTALEKKVAALRAKRAAVRAKAFEEAAEIAKAHRGQKRTEYEFGYTAAAEQIENEIRALSEESAA